MLLQVRLENSRGSTRVVTAAGTEVTDFHALAQTQLQHIVPRIAERGIHTI